jgi:hypothetical protein
MKKLFLGLGLCFLGILSQAQNGLESIYVEKYYVATAADAAASSGTLPEGSVTWRIYADMLPGYKFQVAYGDERNAMIFSTSTTFFNNEDRGATTPAYTKTQAATNTVMLDSWLSVGAACAGQFGILKSEDNGVSTVVHPAGILANTDPSIGIPLTTQDGLIAGAPQSVTFVGLSTELDVFDATSQVGNICTSTNGGWSALSGATGPTASNRVLIAQITTDGVLNYQFNIQIGTPTGDAEKYVVSNPLAGELTIPSLKGILGAPVVKPVVNSLVVPTNSITGDVVAISATANDADGSIASIEFFVDGVSVGVDNTTPFTASYTGTVVGPHTVTAVAKDNEGNLSVANPIATLTVGPNQAPTAIVSVPASSVLGDAITISASATDVDGSVASVQFFVGGVSIGTDNLAPYTVSYTPSALGTYSITAKATDNKGLQGAASVAVSHQVKNNVPPTVTITAPANGVGVNVGTSVSISATAGDVDGTVTSVEFKVDGISQAVVNTAPFQTSWTPTAEGTASIIAIVTDNKGATTTSAAVTIVINDPNALPYEVTSVVQKCLDPFVCVPVASKKATMANVIGYDVVMNYDNQKVKPTGAITVSNDLINSAYTQYVTNIDSANGLMFVTIYFDAAPAGTNFNGEGKLFCAEFAKLASFKSYDTTIFSVSKLEESYLTSVVEKPVKAGTFRTYKDSLFTGKLAYWFDGQPIKYDVANPNDYLISEVIGAAKPKSATNNVQPDLNGNFIFNIWNGNGGPSSTTGKTLFHVERDINASTLVLSVINNDDALEVAKYASEKVEYTPSVFQMIAADVNGDGQISAGDASQISQRYKLIIPEYTQVWNKTNGKPSKDWRFVDADTLLTNAYKISTTFPKNNGIGYSKYKVPVVDTLLSVPVADLSCPNSGLVSETYKGILLGDINRAGVTGGYSDIAHDGVLKSAKVANNNSSFQVNVYPVGSDYKADVILVSTEKVQTWNLAFGVDESKVLVKEFQDGDNYSAINKTLILGTFSINGLPTNTVATSFVLSPVNGETFTKSALVPKINTINAEVADIKFVEGTTGINSVNAGSVNVYPTFVTENVSVSSSENVNVQIIDLSGKVVFQSVEAQQLQTIDANNLVNGVYMVKVYNNNIAEMQKIVVQK